jgi:lysozyme
MTVTQEQADALLLDDITRFANCVNAAVDVLLTQPEFDAIVDLVFNIGCPAFCDSTLRRLLNTGDYPGAAKQFDEWDHCGGKVVAGLLRRREAETQEFDTA